MFLLARHGSFSGRLFPLTNEFFVGLNHKNKLSVMNERLIHFRFSLQSDGTNKWVSLRCLTKKCSVNSKLVMDAKIVSGDFIQIEDNSFVLLDNLLDLFFFREKTDESFFNTIKEEDTHVESLDLSNDLPLPEKETANLVSFCRHLPSLGTYEEVASTVMDYLRKLFPSRAQWFFSWNDATGKFDLCKHHSSDQHLDIKFPLSSTLMTLLLGKGQVVSCQNLELDPRFKSSESLQGGVIRSFIAMPLLFQNHIKAFVFIAGSDNKVSIFNPSILTLTGSFAALCLQSMFHDRSLKFESTQNLAVSETKSRYEKLSRQSELDSKISRMAPTDLCILIRGETGVGKEWAARKIHSLSLRHRQLMLSLNCAAFSDTLLESELFGHEKGAFTGATQKKIGMLEAPDGGTLFLDEVGELSLPAQAKLLRFIQEKEFQRLGSTKTIRVDVRILAATNRDLEKMVKDGLFRQDLYYRLKVFQLTLSPLRKTPEKVRPLIKKFFTEMAVQMGEELSFILDVELQSRLEKYSWPGNIRELKNATERAFVLSRGNPLSWQDFFDEDSEVTPTNSQNVKNLLLKSYRDCVEVFEKEYFEKLLSLKQGNISKVAQVAGLDRSHVYAKLKKHGINHQKFRL